jgi:hypothetical protein
MPRRTTGLPSGVSIWEPFNVRRAATLGGGGGGGGVEEDDDPPPQAAVPRVLAKAMRVLRRLRGWPGALGSGDEVI